MPSDAGVRPRAPRLLLRRWATLPALALLATSPLGRAQAQAQAQTEAQATQSTRQGLFSWAAFAPRPPAVDYARHYTRVEDCLAAVERVRDSANWGTALGKFDPTRWEDVLAATDRRRPESPGVVATAQQCGAQFTAATAAAVDLPFLGNLWLVATQDSLVETVLRRQLALLPTDASPATRGKMLAEVVHGFVHTARPARLAWAERLLDEIDRLGEAARQSRLDAYGSLFHYAVAVYDTLRFDRYLNAASALADSMPSQSSQVYRATAIHYQRLRAMAQGQAVEPLAVAQARMSAVRGGQTVSPAALAALDSVRVPALEGAFWFRRPDSAAPRPTRGKPNLVLFVDDLGDGSNGSAAAAGIAELRELHRRLGDALEITLVAHTHGHFRDYPPPAPAAEAELLRRYFFDYLKLPGALVVEETPFGHLPPPDGRRVDRLPANVLAYRPDSPGPGRFGLASMPHPGTPNGFLVDAEGRVMLKIEQLGDDDDRLLMREVISGYMTRDAVEPNQRGRP